ncbi:hypothetical protein MYCTH_2122076 [Thermothelomyces thermophilus ATCC 42464]|uniref:Uncharacterized protein n=1 Tax=Thermothelomyces thermophilus (strain ATCC 42464 / BCRC 31852 / DSM 1799) TaxID=573729 RepID=G2Q0T7_THET4|nr:uncharacterized protein MYCTH_2122076 [Thermothelomyces thermophilus ATCC 42464]AEO53237.1 hypothetical protein MYCTH_2122076 [Thermothelomyces thermophilus ATCC 42464]
MPSGRRGTEASSAQFCGQLLHPVPSSLAHRQLLTAAAQHLGWSINLLGQAVCMSAYRPAVQSARYGAVLAHPSAVVALTAACPPTPATRGVEAKPVRPDKKPGSRHVLIPRVPTLTGPGCNATPYFSPTAAIGVPRPTALQNGLLPPCNFRPPYIRGVGSIDWVSGVLLALALLVSPPESGDPSDGRGDFFWAVQCGRIEAEP